MVSEVQLSRSDSVGSVAPNTVTATLLPTSAARSRTTPAFHSPASRRCGIASAPSIAPSHEAGTRDRSGNLKDVLRQPPLGLPVPLLADNRLAPVTPLLGEAVEHLPLPQGILADRVP